MQGITTDLTPPNTATKVHGLAATGRVQRLAQPTGVLNTGILGVVKTNTPRVLVISSSAYTLGGMERVMQTLSRKMPEHGFLASALVPEAHTGDDVRAWFASHGSPCEKSAGLAALRVAGTRAVRLLANELRSKNADLVSIHSPGHHMPVRELLAARLAAIPAIVTIHGLSDLNVSKLHWIRNRTIAGALTTSVVAPSQAVYAQQHAHGLSEDKLRLILNGVPGPSQRVSRAEARTLLGLDPKRLVISSFGRLVPDKGMDTLVQAIELLPDALLANLDVLIGGLGDAESVRRAMGPRGRSVVRMLGHVNETSLYYAASDLFVLPSRHESFGLVFVEAAMHGVPSVATRVGGIGEAVLDGITGLLVEPNNPAEVATAIGVLANDSDQLRRFGAAARVRAQVVFSEDAMAAAYGDLFNSAVDRRNTAASATDCRYTAASATDRKYAAASAA